MSNPADYKYTATHEWLNLAADGTAAIGITDYAQESLGDITFVDLPAVGDSFAKGDTFGAVESVKAASDLYLPVAGEILEVNVGLDDAPESVNNTPYTEGWMIKIKVNDPAEAESLMSAADYEAQL
ncbi:MAG: glycine cleavage system protein GcvH [Verrucomicrobiota bacterium]